MSRRNNKEKRMLAQIRQWNENQSNLEDTIELLWAAAGIRGEFERKNVAVPEWLDAQIRGLNRAIEAQTRDAKELRLKELMAQEAGLLTASERREKVRAEIEALKGQGVGQ